MEEGSILPSFQDVFVTNQVTQECKHKGVGTNREFPPLSPKSLLKDFLILFLPPPQSSASPFFGSFHSTKVDIQSTVG